MKRILRPGFPGARELAGAGKLSKATAALQRLLAEQMRPGAASDGASVPPTGGLPRAGMPEALRGFLDRIGADAPVGRQARTAPPPVPDGARFLDATFSGSDGSRPYKLYVPSGYSGRPVPLVVMLHGCTQSPDDFAAGTRMNEAAERDGFLVAYPGQPSSANAQRCWNWFKQGDQRRGGGEPAIIAGITREVMRGYAVDPRRVYVAGLSAGGAAAAIMAQAYPDLYAAAGVHSGLACGAASDLHSAFAAMQNGSPGRTDGSGIAGGGPRRTVPTIVFHGDRDGTVSPRNGDSVVAQATRGARLAARTDTGEVRGGHPYTRTTYADGAGRAVVEQWVVHGAGHAWFGGSPAGSYTDPHGPDATHHMLRFFQEHPQPPA